MKKALFITSFNDPESAEISMAQFKPLFQGCEFILSDQSTDTIAIDKYKSLCRNYGFNRIHNMNGGASAAKRRIIQIASDEGYDVMHQLSEDFELMPIGEENPSTPNGRNSFISDSESLLNNLSHISFVHWNWFRHSKHVGYFWNLHRSAVVNINHASFSKLAYMTGEISLFNWPYSGKVDDLVGIQKKASKTQPATIQQTKDNLASNGEWAQAHSSVGRGVALYAHPVRHRNRVKPEGSMP